MTHRPSIGQCPIFGGKVPIMEQAEKRRINLDLDIPTYVRIKRRAAAEHRTMAGMIRLAIENYMKENDDNQA